MESFTENLNALGAIGVIAGQVFIVLIIGLKLYSRFANAGSRGATQTCNLLRLISSHGIILGFIVAVTAVAVSLIYSDVIGFEPCKLCWIQRIFLYPQVIILGLAIWKKTKDAATYCLSLSTIGIILAFYHYYGQMFNPGVLPACDVAGNASCAVRFFVQFGYITIPMMSLTAFLLITILMLLAKQEETTL